MINFSKVVSFDDAVFKHITKCETSMLLLSSHNSVQQFTFDVVVGDGKESGRGRGRPSGGLSDTRPTSNVTMAQAWLRCEDKGFHGMQALSLINASCMPNNGCRERYSVAQYVNSLIHSIEAYFMFQKPSCLFCVNAVDLWQTFEELELDTCYIVMVWKFKNDPNKDASLRISLNKLNTSPTSMRNEPPQQKSIFQTTPTASQLKDAPKRKSVPLKPQISESTVVSKRGRRSVCVAAAQDTDTNIDEDGEITFKTKSTAAVIPQVKYLPEMSPKKLKAAAVVEPQPEDNAEDITFSFERSQSKTSSRKSSARKSLMPEWPDLEKDDVLCFFDNLNPKQTEQTCIALTCKFASMKYDRELPSKLLYQWVQKKGRTIQKTVNSYDLPEKEQKETMVQFFKSLNPDLSEATRVAFTCKFMQTQFGVAVQSKQFYSVLGDTGKKSSKRR